MNDVSRLRSIRERNRILDALPSVKVVFEVLAYVFGAIFLLTKLLGGQENSGMDVSLDLKRTKSVTGVDRDQIAVTLKLKRSDIGRLRLDDIAVDVVDLADPSSSLSQQRADDILRERVVTSDKDGMPRIGKELMKNGLYLPPNDGTQLAYWFSVKRGSPIRVDVTITSTRTGFWIGNPQWRASAISLPLADTTKSD
jgi:hypothetical protein